MAKSIPRRWYLHTFCRAVVGGRHISGILVPRRRIRHENCKFESTMNEGDRMGQELFYQIQMLFRWRWGLYSVVLFSLDQRSMLYRSWEHTKNNCWVSCCSSVTQKKTYKIKYEKEENESIPKLKWLLSTRTIQTKNEMKLCCLPLRTISFGCDFVLCLPHPTFLYR